MSDVSSGEKVALDIVTSLNQLSKESPSDSDIIPASAIAEKLLGVYHNVSFYEELGIWNLLLSRLKSIVDKKSNEGDLGLYFWTLLFIVVRETNEALDSELNLDEELGLINARILDVEGVSEEEKKTHKSLLAHYRTEWSREFEKSREAQKTRELIEGKIADEFLHFKNLEDSMVKRLKGAEDNIRAALGETSFISASQGFSQYSKKILRGLRVVRFFRYLVMFLMFLVPVKTYLIVYDEEQAGATARVYERLANGIQAEEDRAVDKSFVSSLVSGFDSYTLKYGLVYASGLLVLLFIFKVLLKEEKELASVFHELEFKAAITSFYRAHLEIVKEFEGDVSASISNYEEFIYRPGERRDEEMPEFTDGFNKTLCHIEKIVKAANSRK